MGASRGPSVPGGCQHEAEDAVGVLGELLQHGQHEGCSLATARLGAAQAVAAWGGETEKNGEGGQEGGLGEDDWGKLRGLRGIEVTKGNWKGLRGLGGLGEIEGT